MIQFVTANKLTTAANAILLQATAPLHLLYLAPWLLRERIARRDLIWFAVLAAAVAMFFVDANDPAAGTPNPFLGNLLGAGSGFTWALTVLGLRWLSTRTGQDVSMASSVLMGNVIAVLFCMPFAFPFPDPVPIKEWFIVVYLGVFQIAVAYVLMIGGLMHVPVFAASLLLLTEDALNPLFVWIVHDEVPGRWALAGGATILAAVLVRSWIDARQRPATAAMTRLES